MTLWEADEMDTIFSALHDGSDGLSEAVYLLPQCLHTGNVVKQGYCGHIGTWMRLRQWKEKWVSLDIKNENYAPSVVIWNQKT